MPAASTGSTSFTPSSETGFRDTGGFFPFQFEPKLIYFSDCLTVQALVVLPEFPCRFSSLLDS